MHDKRAQRHQVLHELDDAGGVSPGAARQVMQRTGIPEAEVYGVATFYRLLQTPGVTRVCTGTSCQLRGSDALLARSAEHGEAVPYSCLGQCDRAPAALDPQLEVVADAPRGTVTPDDPELAVNLGGADDAGYEALATAEALGAEEVIARIEASGLQGRGGAGFPAHIKWKGVRAAAGRDGAGAPCLVVNADEAEPGTFKDREVMLRRPHRLLEGVAIAAATIGASEVWIYIRGEFRACRRSVEAALQAAGLPLDVKLVEGHGAYICGEETALLESIEGKRGMPRLKPPYPTDRGLFGRPTLIHNVETLACVPAIVAHGGAWFRDLGRTEPGTKLYCVSGHVQRPGVYELPTGVSLDELVAAAGGYEGTPRAFSPGGASSGFLPMRFRDTPLDFASLAEAGSMLGSAGVVVLNDTVDMAEAAAWGQRFFEDETCGQCAPCRIGCSVQKQAVDRYLGDRDPAHLARVDDIHTVMHEGSICGLGMTASAPLRSAMEHFPEDFA